MRRDHRPAVVALLVVGALALIALITRSPSRPFLSDVERRDPAAGGWTTQRLEAMHTTFELTLPDRAESGEAAEAVFAIFRRVEAVMNEWKEDSPLAAVNRGAGGDPVPVPEDLRRLLRRGVEIGELTGGAFDVTWAALWGLWDFRADPPRVPDSTEVARRVALIDGRRLEIDDVAGTAQLPRAGMLIGLGGIAKGYALDLAAAELRRRDFPDFLITGGGQVMAGGTRGGRAWRVGIRDPRGGPGDTFATLQIADLSVSTSGDYERFFTVDGVRHHHILDPRTGFPGRGLRSATVLSADATLADALSTAIMVLGPERGMALVESLEGVELVLVDDAGRVRVSPGLGDRIVMHRDPRPE